MLRVALLMAGMAAFSTVLVAQVEPKLADLFSKSVANPHYWKADSIKWNYQFPDGTKLAILEGPRDVPGQFFSYAFYMPDGVWIKPHWHCADARVFVVKGTLLLGFQSEFDKNKTLAMQAGDYFVVPFRYPHFEGSVGETLIIGTGVGPWCTVDLK